MVVGRPDHSDVKRCVVGLHLLQELGDHVERHFTTALRLFEVDLEGFDLVLVAMEVTCEVANEGFAGFLVTDSPLAARDDVEILGDILVVCLASADEILIECAVEGLDRFVLKPLFSLFSCGFVCERGIRRFFIGCRRLDPVGVKCVVKG